MSISNQLKVTVTQKVDGKVHKQSSVIKNGRMSSIEKSVEDEKEMIEEPVTSSSNQSKSNKAETESDHPMDVMIDSAYVMTSKMPMAGPYVKLAMDGVHFKQMVHDVADIIFKPFFPMPKIKK